MSDRVGVALAVVLVALTAVAPVAGAFGAGGFVAPAAAADGEAVADNEPPTVHVVQDPARPTVGTSVLFFADASDPDGNVTEYVWTVDGEVVSSRADLSWTVESAGTHEVSLAVTDDDGSTATATTTVDIEAGTAARFAVGVDSTNAPVTEGERLTVNATVENTAEWGGTQQVRLFVGDAQRDAREVTLGGGENRTVTLSWATDDGDAGGYVARAATANDTAETDVTVEEPSATGGTADVTNAPPTVTASADPGQPTVGEPVLLSADATDEDGEVVAYEWRVDGEPVSAEPRTELTLQEAGEHELTVRVTDDDGATSRFVGAFRVRTEQQAAAEAGAPIEANVTGEADSEFTGVEKGHDLAVPFHSGTVELAAGLDSRVLETDRERAWVVLQFGATPQYERLAELEVSFDAPLAYRTYYAAVPTANTEELASLESVRAVAAVRPEWKRLPAFADRLNGTESVPATVVGFANLTGTETAARLELEPVPNRDRTYRTRLTAERAAYALDDPAVKWVERYVEPETSLTGGNRMVASRPVKDNGVTGTSARVAVVDTGIDHDHPHFNGVTIDDNFDKRDGDLYPEADNWGADGNSHGTHVAGTIAGLSRPSGRFLEGVAPNATLVVARGLGEDQFDRVSNDNPDVISNSWGAGVNGYYVSGSRYTDKWAREHPQTLVVVANGNYNASNPNRQWAEQPAVAKNVVSVGALNDGTKFRNRPDRFRNTVDRVNNVAWLNNKSAPRDGRTKPDVNAPGAWITAPVVNDSYSTYVGTSMATPHVSGIAALYEDLYAQRDPSANEVKAALVAAAGPVENPNPSQRPDGFGGVDAHNTLYRTSYESQSFHYTGRWQARDVALNGASPMTHRFHVQSGAEQVVVSLSWFDPPGSTASGDNLVNDLDLYVGPTSDPRRYKVTDRRNNVNRVTVNPSGSETGTDWQVTVVPHELSVDVSDVLNDRTTQSYDGKVSVVTEEPTLDARGPERLVVAPQRYGGKISFGTDILGTGAAVTGVRGTVDWHPELSKCSGPTAFVAGTLSEGRFHRETFCFRAPTDAGVYPVDITVNSTNAKGGTMVRTVDIVVPEPRVELEPFERSVYPGGTTTYEVVVENVSDGVGSFNLYLEQENPSVGSYVEYTHYGYARGITSFGANNDSVSLRYYDDHTDDYGTAKLGRLKVRGDNAGRTNLTVQVSDLQDEAGDRYPLRPQVGIPSDPLTLRADGELNVLVGIDSDQVDPVVGDPVQFDGSAFVDAVRTRVDVTDVEWDFDDGSSATGESAVSHTYEEPGNYTVRLLVVGGGEEYTTSREVRVASADGGNATDTETNVSVQLDGAPDGLRQYEIGLYNRENGTVTAVEPGLIAGDGFEVSAGGVGNGSVTARGVEVTTDSGNFTDSRTLFTATYDGDRSAAEFLVDVAELVNDSGGPISRDRVSIVVGTDGPLFTEPLPGSSGSEPPQDANGDGVIEDLNGDGVEDFSDVITLAFSLDADLTSEQVAAVDYDDSGGLGFGDVVELAFSL